MPLRRSEIHHQTDGKGLPEMDELERKVEGPEAKMAEYLAAAETRAEEIHKRYDRLVLDYAAKQAALEKAKGELWEVDQLLSGGTVDIPLTKRGEQLAAKQREVYRLQAALDEATWLIKNAVSHGECERWTWNKRQSAFLAAQGEKHE